MCEHAYTQSHDQLQMRRVHNTNVFVGDKFGNMSKLTQMNDVCYYLSFISIEIEQFCNQMYIFAFWIETILKMPLFKYCKNKER